jgi:hypothetical protein
MTVIECVSPSGLSVPPSYILSSRPTLSFPNLSGKIGAIATFPNGWTDNEISTMWFIEMFILFPFANNHKVTDASTVHVLTLQPSTHVTESKGRRPHRHSTEPL